LGIAEVQIKNAGDCPRVVIDVMRPHKSSNITLTPTEMINEAELFAQSGHKLPRSA
jgi:hypothetical protein